MSAPKRSDTAEDGSPKIYLLPNLMTAGNLFCGFLATLQEFINHRTNAIATHFHRF